MAYTLEQAQELILKAGLELVNTGLIARTWGNISARLSATEFLITPSGRAYESLTASDLVVVNIDDLSYEGDVKPSSEKAVHAKAYKIRKDVNFIIHTHQTNASAISILGKDELDITEYGEEVTDILGKRIPIAAYGVSSTKRLTDNVADAIGLNQDCCTTLMKNHGAVIVGADYDSAFKAAHVLEDVCGKIYNHICGVVPASEEPVTEVLKDDENGCLMRVTSTYVMAMSRYGNSMRMYLDDLAQMAGTSVPCFSSDTDMEVITNTLKDIPMILVQNRGAYVFGFDNYEAEAAAMVLEKGAKSAYLGRIKKRKPIDPASASMEHVVYVTKYSKLK